MVFANAGTAIVELIPDKYMTPLFKQMAIDCNHRYSTLLGSMENSGDSVGLDLEIESSFNKHPYLNTSARS